MNNKDKFEKANQNILDCFSGANNGLFWEYLKTMRQLSECADNGDASAVILVDVVVKFSKLLDILDK